MKKVIIICLSLFYMSLETTAQTTFTVKEQLEKVNKYWAYNNCDFPILEERAVLKTDEELIQTHLTLVEKHLRNKHVILTETQKQNRLLCLDILKEYSKRGVFPINLYHSSRTPYFIDNFGTACAVGQLVISTGHEELAKTISRENNYEYIENMNYPELLTWADNYGFTLDELKWIQPTYSCQACPNNTQRNVSCFGGNDGCIGAFPTPTSISPPYSYSWFSFDSTSNTWNVISQPCDLTAGTYKCIISSGSTGDTEDLIFLITQPDPVSVSLTATIDNSFIPNNVVCKGDTVTLQVHDSLNSCGNSYYWLYINGYPWGISADGIFLVTPDSTTTYEVHACCTETPSITLNVINSPAVFSIGSDTVLCVGDTFSLSAPSGYDYLWQDGSSDSIFTVTEQGTYFVEISNQCGSSSDTIQITYQIPPVVSLGNDTTLCVGDSLLLTTPYGYDHLWQDGSFDSIFTVTEQGIYFVEVSNQCGSASDTVQITYQTPPVISLGNDTTLCFGDSLLLTTPSSYDYLWQDGSFDSIFTVTEQGIYFVEVSNQCGGVSDTIQITYQAPPIISLGNDTTLCVGDTFQLYASAGDYSLLWQDGSTDTMFSATSTDTYWLTASNLCGINSDTINIDFSSPFVNIGEDTIICNNTTISFDAGSWYSYEWSTGDTVQTINFSGKNTTLTIWLTVEDEFGCIATDSVSVTFDPCLGKRSQEFFSDVIIFPNPAKNEINIHIKNYDNSPFHCQIINPQGKQIKTFTISNETYLLNTQDISSGIYYLIIENKNQRMNKKMVIIDN